jgi:hypothetical protein
LWQLGTVQVQRAHSANATHQSASYKNHRVLHQFILRHKLFHFDVFAISKEIRSFDYYFLDTQMTLLYQTSNETCLDGVWGRTSCAVSNSPFAKEEYGLEHLLSSDFPLHNLYTVYL